MNGDITLTVSNDGMILMILLLALQNPQDKKFQWKY